jgi:hypothetical protein
VAGRRPPRRTAKRPGRVYTRDARGRFTPTGASDARKRKRRRQAAVAGTAFAATAVAASQAHPASRTTTAVARRKLITSHVARAQADHERLASVRARVFPTTAVTGPRFKASAARREARKLTKGYRKSVKTVRKSARKAR